MLRRVFLTSLSMSFLYGCSTTSKKTIALFYSNETGRWIEGPISIGDNIYDMFTLSPFAVTETTARMDLLVNAAYRLTCQDIYSGDKLNASGVIGIYDGNFSNPSLLLALQDDGSIRSSWQERDSIGVRGEFLEPHAKTVPLLISVTRQKPSFGSMQLAIRQRPRRFVSTYFESNFQSRITNRFLFAVSRIMSPVHGWESVVFFSTDQMRVTDTAITWRDTFDLRTVPGFEPPNCVLWIEVEQNGQYKLAWKKHPETDERQLREQLQKNQLEPPQDWLVRQAQRHDELTLVSLHRGNQTKIPDLRFDDEIAQQK